MKGSCCNKGVPGALCLVKLDKQRTGVTSCKMKARLNGCIKKLSIWKILFSSLLNDHISAVCLDLPGVWTAQHNYCLFLFVFLFWYEVFLL